ncbi:MAG: STAS domain-containing protein [Deinococcales bacterium]
MITWNVLDNHSAHIIIKGRLDLHTSPELRQRLRDLRIQGHALVFIDTSEVDFMSSSGLAVLVAALRASRRQSGELCLIAPSEAIRTVLDYTRLEQVIPIFKDLDSARERLDGNAPYIPASYDHAYDDESSDDSEEA